MLGLWVADLIEFADGEKLSAEPKTMLAYAMNLKDNVDIYFYDGDKYLEKWMAYMLHIFCPKHTGGKNTFNVLCGVNRVLYHATYTNPDGIKFRVMTFENLIPTARPALAGDFGGSGGADSAMRAIRMADRMGIHGLTIGSYAMQNFRNDFGVKKYFEKFPNLDEKLSTDLRAGYIGGYVMALPGDYDRCVDIDCNGMYSSILRDEFLPFGPPEPYDGKYEYDKSMPYHIDVITFRADLKEDGYAFLSSPHFVYSDDRDRMISTHGYITMPLTDIDQELLQENYEVSIYEYEHGWKFARSKGFFKLWVDGWDTVKEKSTGGQRTLAKWIPNSMVGKFGTVPRKSCLEPYIDPENDEKVDWKVEQYDKAGASYLPVSMYVTALGRRKIMNAMRKQKNRIIYANTDGFMMVGSKKDIIGLDLDKRKTGKWKIEGDYKKVRILGVGLYQGEKTTGGFDLISSGISRNTPIPWEQFYEGKHILDDYGDDIVL